MTKLWVVSVVGVVFPLVVQAASLSDFVTYSGETIINFAGQALSKAGDVNGDGYDDFIVGSFFNSDNGDTAGAVYLVYGQDALLESTNLSTAVEFTGETAGDYAGWDLSAAGDVNNDGYDDFLIGAYQNDSVAADAGAAYLIYGQSTPLTSASLATAVEFTGEAAGDQAGWSVAGVGDVDNDGFDDFVIGALYNDDAGISAGAAYLFYGQTAQYTSASVSTGAQFSGVAAYDAAGDAVSNAGDVDGDGYDDFIIGASYNDDYGTTYLVYGQSTRFTTKSLSTVVEFQGENSGDRTGAHLSAAGDVNNDGYDDFLIGSVNNDSAGDNAGASYLLYGRSTDMTSTTLAASAVKFSGEAAGDQAGIYVGGGGDVNADGYDDVIIGARLNDDSGADAGAAYVVYGQSTALTSANLSTAVQFSGVTEGELAGEGVDIAGDVNNDGYDDIIVGAAQNDNTMMNAGVVYLGYLTVDVDGDGVTGAEGVISPGTDCNDSDATVSTAQTYYVDADEDGLGSTTTAQVCSATPTTGYSSNASDTNDTIANNGVEIADDTIDNDGDGQVDEENTVDDNGEHPGLGDTDPADTDAFSQYVTAVVGGTNGSIVVTYSDNSVYRYTVFAITTETETAVANYDDTGYIIVVHPTSKKLALVNVYDGTVYQRLRLTKQAMVQWMMRLFDLRSDDVTEVVIISNKGKSARVAIVQVDLASGSLTLVDRIRVVGKKITPQRSRLSAKKITLKRKVKTVHTLRVNKYYNLVQQ